MANPSYEPAAFRLVIERIGTELPRAAVVEAQKWAAGSALSKITARSPVDTSRFRSNWNVSLDVVDTSTDNALSNVVPGAPMTAEERQRLEAVLARLTDDQVMHVVWIANGLPYAPVIEFGLYPGGGPKTTSAGYSTQAPAGVLRVSAAEVVSEFNRSPVLRARLERITAETIAEATP